MRGLVEKHKRMGQVVIQVHITKSLTFIWDFTTSQTDLESQTNTIIDNMGII